MLKILGFIAGMFTGGQGASKAAGIGNGIALFGAIGGGILWILGPGREWHITLNALELSGVVLIASLLLEWVRHMPPPNINQGND